MQEEQDLDKEFFNKERVLKEKCERRLRIVAKIILFVILALIVIFSLIRLGEK